MAMSVEELTNVIALHRCGLTAKEIGFLVCYAPSTIEKRLKVLGYRCNGGSGHGGRRPGSGRNEAVVDFF